MLNSLVLATYFCHQTKLDFHEEFINYGNNPVMD